MQVLTAQSKLLLKHSAKLVKEVLEDLNKHEEILSKEELDRIIQRNTEKQRLKGEKT